MEPEAPDGHAAAMSRVFALVDGNAFYCSCERLFDPNLKARPVIVLSNNDGCAVARSDEAKALGIKMGAPYFQIRDLCRRERVAVFSSNYTLYGDMSARLNAVYRLFSPDVEIYSIDESFLDLAGIAQPELVEVGREIKATALRWVGIPTCVGIGPTKTLAKLANKIAKTTPQLGGVCDLSSAEARAEWLPLMPLADIWGVGRAGQARLAAFGCRTAADVAALDLRLMRKAMTVVGERIVLELRGEPCMDLETVAPTRKGCAVTRCFSGRVEDIATIEEAVAAHATRLGEKLRRYDLATDHVTVFYHTSEHDRTTPQRSVSLTVHLPEHTNDTLILVRAARWAARRIWASGYRYSKSGVLTSDLAIMAEAPRALIGAFNRERSGRLMEALDACNQRFGRGKVVPAAAGLERARSGWATKFEMRSPRYTTRIDELPIVRAA